MKKVITLLSIVLVFMVFASIGSFASDDIKVIVNGDFVETDVSPVITDGRTLLPVRAVCEALGAKVDWIEESQTVKITAENIDISLVIGETFATVNGEKIDLDSPSFIENDRTYLPIRFVSEKLGADVQWDDATQTVNITK